MVELRSIAGIEKALASSETGALFVCSGYSS
jgi:hypothetical protein